MNFNAVHANSSVRGVGYCGNPREHEKSAENTGKHTREKKWQPGSGPSSPGAKKAHYSFGIVVKRTKK